MAGTGFAGLGGAVGAGEALKELIAQRLLQAKFAEEQRQAQAQEQHQGRALQEQTALRQQQQQGLEQERLRDEAFRQQQLGQQRQMGEASLAQARSIQEMLEGGRKERADEAAQNRLELARLTASLRPPPSEPLYPVQGPDGTPIYAPRSQAVGQVRAASGAEREEGRSFDDVKEILNTIKTAYDPSFVGPVQYRAKALGQTLGRSNPRYAAFRQAITALQNATTRLAFSSRASDQDVARAIAEGANPSLSEADFIRQVQGIEQRLRAREDAFRQSTGITP